MIRFDLFVAALRFDIVLTKKASARGSIKKPQALAFFSCLLDIANYHVATKPCLFLSNPTFLGRNAVSFLLKQHTRIIEICQ